MSLPAPEPTDLQEALIVANGGRVGSGMLRRLHQQARVIIATDGAASRLLRRGITPDFVVGDLDSLDAEARSRIPAASLVYAPDQDRCDLDKAIEVSIERGFRHITVVGGLGRRWDHSLTTISLLIAYADKARVRLVRGSTVIMAVTDRLTISGSAGDRLSLIAFAPVQGVTLTGVAWPLNCATIRPGSQGVSNRMTQAVAELTVESGCVVVCHHASRREARP